MDLCIALCASILACATAILYLLYHTATHPAGVTVRATRAVIMTVFIFMMLRIVSIVADGLLAQSNPLVWSIEDPMFVNGARIVDAWTSPSYSPSGVDLYTSKMRNPHVDNLVRQSHGPISLPEIAIGLFADSRALWFFAGQHATLAVAMPDLVLVESIRLKANSKERCHPRDVNVWGLVLREAAYNITPSMLAWPPPPFPAELHKRPSVGYGSFWGTLMGPYPFWIPLTQLRDVPLGARGTNYAIAEIIAERGIAVHAIALEFMRNWGSEYSCFAGLGIAGRVV